jgi:hypothetical protein
VEAVEWVAAEEVAVVAAEVLPGVCMCKCRRRRCTPIRSRSALHYNRSHYTGAIHTLPEITEELAHKKQHVSKPSTYCNWGAGTARELPSTKRRTLRADKLAVAAVEITSLWCATSVLPRLVSYDT